MKTEKAKSSPTAWMLWRRNGIIWLALLSLLTISLVLAYIPMGLFTPTSGIIVAVIKAGLVVVLFMELSRAKSLIRLAAMAGLVFVLALFALTLSDVLARLWG